MTRKLENKGEMTQAVATRHVCHGSRVVVKSPRILEARYAKDFCLTKLLEVYPSWMSDALSRFNSDLFYQSRNYIAECYRAGKILAA